MPCIRGCLSRKLEAAAASTSGPLPEGRHKESVSKSYAYFTLKRMTKLKSNILAILGK
jgi:hypothetical protein